ncbi:helix-turn-helix domain-containing protein [Streptosporangium sp. NPDC003464]
MYEVFRQKRRAVCAGAEQRQALRLRAADMFAGGIRPPRVAQQLGVTRKSAYEWHRAWQIAGKAALASKGASGTGCKLTDEQLTHLETALEQGAATYGWSDQRWTASRVATLIAETFHVSYTARDVVYLLRRLGWSFQVPAHWAARRDNARVAEWTRRVWPAIKAPGRLGDRGWCSPTNPAKS